MLKQTSTATHRVITGSGYVQPLQLNASACLGM